MRSLNRDHAFSERQLLPLVETLKQDLCFLSPSYSDFSNVAKRTHFFQNRCRFSEHRMPDGQLIRLNSSQFDCAEVLISPGIACLDLEGIPQGILRVIEKAPLDLRLPLVQSLSFYGGGSKLTGLPSRVSDEVTRLYNTSICHETRLDCLMVSLPQHAEESAFLGASCIANLEMETSQSEWLAREQWQEIGSCRAAGVMCASRFGEGS
ncbi:MAG: uncharacterized protein KVP18_004497 [Porospora cf. gigantea A]|nr:MAG: hypothetical protein KVP18_004497 [Porospora cf. gigantea A]